MHPALSAPCRQLTRPAHRRVGHHPVRRPDAGGVGVGQLGAHVKAAVQLSHLAARVHPARGDCACDRGRVWSWARVAAGDSAYLTRTPPAPAQTALAPSGTQHNTRPAMPRQTMSRAPPCHAMPCHMPRNAALPTVVQLGPVVGLPDARTQHQVAALHVHLRPTRRTRSLTCATLRSRPPASHRTHSCGRLTSSFRYSCHSWSPCVMLLATFHHDVFSVGALKSSSHVSVHWPGCARTNTAAAATAAASTPARPILRSRLAPRGTHAAHAVPLPPAPPPLPSVHATRSTPAQRARTLGFGRAACPTARASQPPTRRIRAPRDTRPANRAAYKLSPWVPVDAGGAPPEQPAR
jgi:hypothetical protein